MHFKSIFGVGWGKEVGQNFHDKKCLSFSCHVSQPTHYLSRFHSLPKPPKTIDYFLEQLSEGRQCRSFSWLICLFHPFLMLENTLLCISSEENHKGHTLYQKTIFVVHFPIIPVEFYFNYIPQKRDFGTSFGPSVTYFTEKIIEIVNFHWVAPFSSRKSIYLKIYQNPEFQNYSSTFPQKIHEVNQLS